MSIENHNEYRFRLFSYFAMAIVSIAILVGLVFLFQHTEINKNQKTLLENQALIKQLIDDAKSHEIREETMLGNNTSTNIGISSDNSEKLDKLLAHFNITTTSP
jgi:type II secretory pathway pseudopilin PulG